MKFKEEHQKGPVKLIKWVKIAIKFYIHCQISSTLSFEAFICNSTNGCQRISRNRLLKMEVWAVLICRIISDQL